MVIRVQCVFTKFHTFKYWGSQKRFIRFVVAGTWFCFYIIKILLKTEIYRQRLKMYCKITTTLKSNSYINTQMTYSIYRSCFTCQMDSFFCPPNPKMYKVLPHSIILPDRAGDLIILCCSYTFTHRYLSYPHHLTGQWKEKRYTHDSKSLSFCSLLLTAGFLH